MYIYVQLGRLPADTRGYPRIPADTRGLPPRACNVARVKSCKNTVFYECFCVVDQQLSRPHKPSKQNVIQTELQGGVENYGHLAKTPVKHTSL